MDKYFNKTYNEILKEASSGSPTPGGGSIAAIAACLGNSMVSMVGNLTTGKEKYEEFKDDVEKILIDSKNIMKLTEDLVDKDMLIFNNFMKTLKMPKETEQEKILRFEAVQKAYISATEVPLEIADVCLEILKLSSRICFFGNKTAISDVGVAAYISEAALYSALLSVDINLGGIKNIEFVNKTINRKALLISRAKELREKTIVTVRDRM